MMPDSANSNARTFSSVREEKSAFGDPDVTPKPLRIVKRASLQSSDRVTIKSLPSPPNSPTQDSDVPIRRSAVSINRTGLDLAQKDVNSPACRSGHSITSLRVQKLRRSSSSNTSSAALSAALEYLDGSNPLPTDRELGEQPSPTITDSRMNNATTRKEIKVSSATKLTPKRAFTTVVFAKTHWLSTINDVPLIAPTTSVTVAGRRRAVTINGETGTEHLNSSREHVLQRQPSFKGRLMTRVMSGLSSKARPRHGTKEEKLQNHQLLPQNTTVAATRIRQGLDAVSRSVSSSTGTSTRSGSDLEGALSVFPTPPTSNDISPTSAVPPRSSRPSSNPTSPTGSTPPRSLRPPSQRYRNLRKPEDAAIMGAELRVTSECDELDMENGKTMLVAIDFQGAMNTTISGQNLWSQHTGLDVVVVIDNSIYISPSALMASCEATRSLGMILNIVTDRMAILCTLPLYNSDPDSTLIWPLSQVKMPKIKIAVDAITTTMEKSTAPVWKNVINSAKDILLQSMVPNDDDESLQDTFGHIFILTAAAEGLSSELLTHEKIQFHLVCPASVPRESYRFIKCNGWKLLSPSGKEVRAVSASKDTDPSTLSNKLRGLIMHARGGKLKGELGNLVLELRPGLDCSIEEVMGSKHYASVHPGELFTVLVKLKIHACKAQGYSLSRAISLSRLQLDANNILNELDEMLGTSAVKVLTARITYKHSSLPERTTCSAIGDCQLKNQIPHSDDMSPQKHHAVVLPGEGAVLVQKRLAYHVATHSHPRYALSALRKEFGEMGSRSICQDYIKLIMKELRYQARIADRIELGSSPKKAVVPSKIAVPDSSLGRFGQGRFSAENYKPKDWITDAVDGNVFRFEEAHSGILSDLDPDNAASQERQERAEDNDSMLVWTDKERTSVNPHLQGLDHGERTVTRKKDKERKVRIKDLAVRRKKSMGEGTMRNIASFGESMGKGLGGTWIS